MTKFDTIGRTFAVLVCTIVLSATMVLGAVGPATADGQASRIVHAIA